MGENHSGALSVMFPFTTNTIFFAGPHMGFSSCRPSGSLRQLHASAQRFHLRLLYNRRTRCTPASTKGYYRLKLPCFACCRGLHCLPFQTSSNGDSELQWRAASRRRKSTIYARPGYWCVTWASHSTYSARNVLFSGESFATALHNIITQRRCSDGAALRRRQRISALLSVAV